MCDRIHLQKEQEEALTEFVEAHRRVPRENRQKFIYLEFEGGSFVHHPGIPRRINAVYRGDIEELGRAGLVATTTNRNGDLAFDVTSLGFDYYQYLKTRTGKPIQQIEASVVEYLGSAAFRNDHPIAFSKWSKASDVLWGGETEESLTTIGHLCREAVQELADNLVDRLKIDGAPDKKASTIGRMRLVVNHLHGRFGKSTNDWADALLTYWGTIVDLIQRQEHGGQKEGEFLVWEDARRVVFQTAAVMFEIHRMATR